MISSLVRHTCTVPPPPVWRKVLAVSSLMAITKAGMRGGASPARLVLLCIAHDPGARLRDIAASLGITNRSVHAIVTDLTAAGYVVRQKDGRRNCYQIQAHLPQPEPASQEPAIGEVLALLIGNRARQQRSEGRPG
jgi:hypothetical protein